MVLLLSTLLILIMLIRGCVSGEQIKHLRDNIDRNGSFDFDMIDGWEDLEYATWFCEVVCITDFDYRDNPDVQEKIKRVVEQGHIDPEDFNGVRGSSVTPAATLTHVGS